MSYKLDYHYINLDLEIKEIVSITVFPYDFIIDCEHNELRDRMITFLEYLDVDITEISSSSLEKIIQNEFKI